MTRGCRSGDSEEDGDNVDPRHPGAGCPPGAGLGEDPGARPRPLHQPGQPRHPQRHQLPRHGVRPAARLAGRVLRQLVRILPQLRTRLRGVRGRGGGLGRRDQGRPLSDV